MYSIVIPSYNEPDLDILIKKIKAMCDFEVIVVDDGSEPPLALEKSLEKITVIRNKKNRGKGYSILRGIKESNKKGCKYSIVLDADFQHAPEDIRSFINHSKEFNLIIGFRSFKSPMPISRILSNKITSFIISLIIRKKINDSQCGFRMYENSILKNLTFKEDGFQFETEFLLKMPRNIRIGQIPIETIYNKNKSHINKTKDTLKFIKLIVRHLFYGK